MKRFEATKSRNMAEIATAVPVRKVDGRNMNKPQGSEKANSSAGSKRLELLKLEKVKMLRMG